MDNYNNYNNTNDDYRSDEDDNNDKEYSRISHLTLSDYLDCNHTKKIIKDEWNERVRDDLECDICDLFNEYYELFRDDNTKLFKRASSIHEVDLFMLVKHHLVRNYNLDVFKENPSLANPLLNSLDNIIQKRKEMRQQNINENFDKYNKTFTWGK